MKLAHVADSHLGYQGYGKADPETGRNQRTVDFERAFEAAVSGAIGREVELFLHAGDAFHHVRPNWATVAFFIRQMNRLTAADIPTVVIGGNHDTPRLRTSGSVFSALAEALPRTEFVTGYIPRAVAIRDLSIGVFCTPYGALGQSPLQPWDGWDSIAVAHGDKDQFSTEPGGPLWEGHCYTALGHLHIRQAAGPKAWYAGSTERTSWNDRHSAPGWLLVELGQKNPVEIQIMETPHRAMVDLGAIDGQDYDDPALEVLQRADNIGDPGMIARAELYGVDRPTFREVARGVARRAPEVAWDLRIVERGSILEFSDAPTPVAGKLASLEELFERFIEVKVAAGAFDQEFSKTFGDRGREALKRAKELKALEEAG